MNIDELKAVVGENAADEEVKFAAATAEEYIKNYCRVENVPEGLKYTALNMAVDFLRARKLAENDGVKKIEEGDVAVTFEESKKGFDDVTESYKPMLDLFRKAGW